MTRYELGATYLGDDRCRFVVWAPKAERVAVHVYAPNEQIIGLAPRPHGYFEGILEGIEPGSTYKYRLDGGDEWPDPASRFQPDGVHGPSAVVDPSAFSWTDRCWFGVAQKDLVIYELHVGTFSPEGTFDGVVPYLDYLRELGVTALEIMPVSQFPGQRNWGYDGVFPYAVQNSYGGPEGFRRLVNACHEQGLAVLLDCVYNHLGPEGNYLGQFGHYFTDRYHTPWGDAINMDGPWSDEVRRYFIENALYWVREYHLDGFRLDATDRIIDESPVHFLREFATTVQDLGEEIGRRVWIIAESDANDVQWLLPPVLNGYGLDAQWGDDFHHALHALLTGERTGYYEDFGRLSQMAKAFRQDFVYDGIYSEYRKKTHGTPVDQVEAKRFVVASQNHDQIGNRAVGERLVHLVGFESAKLAAAVVLLSPYLPLIFMGQEYAETAPFQYFTSHTDPALQKAVSEGRRDEFKRFNWQQEVPDPQDPETFQRSKLHHDLRDQGEHQVMCNLYRQLLRLRRELPALSHLSKDTLEVTEDDEQHVLVVRRWHGDHEVAMAFNFGGADARVELGVPAGSWRKMIDTSDERWKGPGSDIPDPIESNGSFQIMMKPRSAVLMERVEV